MTWLGPSIAQTDQVWWGLRRVPDGTVIRNFPGYTPHPDTARVDGRFRLLNAHYSQASALRWYVEYEARTDTDPPVTVSQGYGWLDVEPVEGGHLFGTTGPDPAGFEMTIEVRNLDEFPPIFIPGVEIECKLIEPGGEFVGFAQYYPEGTNFSLKPYADAAEGSYGRREDRTSPGWPYLPEPPWFASVADCFSFPPNPDTVEAFARFNGQDASVKLVPATENISGSFLIQAEVFLRTANDVFILSNTTVSNWWLLIDQGTVFWRTTSTPLLQPIPLNEWVHLEFWRNWYPPTNNRMRLSINGTTIASFPGVAWSMPFDTLGAKLGVGGDRWGDFDMKQLVVSEGSPATPLTRLLMPLTANACDQGPANIAGETFNMLLPSCP